MSKDTLQLPKTAFSMKASLPTKEPEILKKWEFDPEGKDGCGNIETEFAFSKSQNQWIHTHECYLRSEDLEGITYMISSQLLLYRLACTFPATIKVNGHEGYKVVWEFPLKHKETGENINFREWKGASGFGTRFYSVEQMPEVLLKDLLALLDYLTGGRCSHPYDRLIAGAVA